jgi:cathepsin L
MFAKSKPVFCLNNVLRRRKHMKRQKLNLLFSAAFLETMVFLMCGNIYAQQDTPQNYDIREQKAPVIEKQRLTDLRKRLQTRKAKFQVGYTYAREVGVKKISGGKKPEVSAAQVRVQSNLAQQLTRIDDDARKLANVPSVQVACNAGLTKWDWRKQSKVTPVKRQMCGNCWAYGAMSAYESSDLIRNNQTVDGSEQYIVSDNNNAAGTCAGGYGYRAMEFLVTSGTAMDSVLPDAGITGSPHPGMATPYDALAWGWVNPAHYDDPGTQNIKEALCQYGPLETWIDSGGTFGDYVSGVYDDDDDKAAGYDGVGHFVTIIGWDEDKGAWIIKNSWGHNWGETAGFGTERGFGWITYRTHSVGSWVTWIQAKGKSYKLPPKYYELVPKRIINPGPVINPALKQSEIIYPEVKDPYSRLGIY